MTNKNDERKENWFVSALNDYKRGLLDDIQLCQLVLMREASAEKAQRLAVEEERERCAKVAENEPELPGHMPDEMWEKIRNDRGAVEEMARISIRLTKSNIAKAIRGDQ